MVTGIGEKIAELRKERKMTQEDLAGLIGVSSQTVSKWETGVTMPDILLLPTLAGIFEVTVDELFSIQRGQKGRSGPIEDIPDAVYDAVLDTMWMWDEGAENNRIKKKLSDNPEMHTGFVSMKQGGVYADKNLALTYIADSETSVALFKSEKAGDFLAHARRPGCSEDFEIPAGTPRHFLYGFFGERAVRHPGGKGEKGAGGAGSVCPCEEADGGHGRAGGRKNRYLQSLR